MYIQNVDENGRYILFGFLLYICAYIPTYVPIIAVCRLKPAARLPAYVHKTKGHISVRTAYIHTYLLMFMCMYD
jgi:hypothetical protein